VSAVERIGSSRSFRQGCRRQPGDDDVVAFVKGNPGAIGYVSAGASTAGVKVIDVK
jgi:ABC-type phosphate transport system substrate-binding protein